MYDELPVYIKIPVYSELNVYSESPVYSVFCGLPVYTELLVYSELPTNIDLPVNKVHLLEVGAASGHMNTDLHQICQTQVHRVHLKKNKWNMKMKTVLYIP